MKRQLILWTNLLALAGCAHSIPPAPTAFPAVSTIPDSLLPNVEISSAGHDATADAALNDLADAAPDSRVVPAFDADEISWDIDVRSFASHPRVQYYLNYFQGVSRQGMTVFLARGARYESMIRRRFEAEGLPGDLGYLALIESGYSNDAVSRSLAVGMWQFMKGFDLTKVWPHADPIDPTDAAARHLRNLRNRFGSLYLAAAAYNAGAGKVSRSLGKLQWDEVAPVMAAPDTLIEAEISDSALAVEDSTSEAQTLSDDDDAPSENTGINSDAAFFRLAGTDLLTLETQDYVPKLIAAALIAKQPERYGLPSPVSAPFVYDSLVVTSTTGLDVVARLAGVSLAEISELNPQYLRLATPPRSEAVIRLPAGTGSKVNDRYVKLKPSGRVRFLTHTVRRGETLSRIAARYHLPLSEIKIANPKLKSSRPKAGTHVVIPAVAAPSALAIRAATGPAFGPRHTHVAVHRVRSGETLIGIARRYRVSLRALRRVNAIPVEYTLRTGMRLRIPS